MIRACFGFSVVLFKDLLLRELCNISQTLRQENRNDFIKVEFITIVFKKSGEVKYQKLDI